MRNERRTPGSARGIRKPLGFTPWGRRMPTLYVVAGAKLHQIGLSKDTVRRIQGSKTGAPECTALVYVDDATSRLMVIHFCGAESAFGHFEATRQYIERHGKPLAFYSTKPVFFW